MPLKTNQSIDDLNIKYVTECYQYHVSDFSKSGDFVYISILYIYIYKCACVCMCLCVCVCVCVCV